MPCRATPTESMAARIFSEFWAMLLMSTVIWSTAAPTSSKSTGDLKGTGAAARGAGAGAGSAAAGASAAAL